MAEVSDVASRVNVPKALTIGDMVSLMRDAQAFRQAEQVNPLAVRKATAETTQAEETMRPNINRAIAESQIQQTSATKSGFDLNQHYANTARGVYGSHLTDPDFINGNTEAILKKLQADRDYLTSIGVPEHQDKGHDKLVELANTDPKQLYQTIKAGVLASGQNQAQTGLVSPRIENINGVPYSYTPAGNVAVPAGVNSSASQPNQNMVAPQAQPTVTQTDMNKPVYSQKNPLPYPARKAGEPYAPGPTEKADQDAGFNIRNSLVGRQSNITTDRRNLLEAEKMVKDLEKEEWNKGAGFPGMVGRNLSVFLGTEQGVKYKQLSKDLANVQISNIQAKGGSLDTVAGQQLTKMANGDETYPPSVLKNIINRAQADITELDKKANASQRFSEKYGDNNMKKFQQEWQKNADSRIFELYNVFNNPDLSQKEKEKARDNLLPKGAKERKVFQEKWNNIQKLEQTGEL
ncbi:hypothetical protein UFOVP96_13 [uncultured Caudovirales phage]|uniref:Uncharacterized protein n=1 Tax=uncultured Caudovirales phage TaxID=2100421 RepID=A0A6J5KYY9_9CAUD|nr:hypothetical protein UFOVP96_13 [uncultured Caudovirales phage]